jgi:hypothetical protein
MCANSGANRQIISAVKRVCMRGTVYFIAENLATSIPLTINRIYCRHKKWRTRKRASQPTTTTSIQNNCDRGVCICVCVYERVAEINLKGSANKQDLVLAMK